MSDKHNADVVPHDSAEATLLEGGSSTSNGIDSELAMLLSNSRTRIVFGSQTLDKIGSIVRDEGASRALLVTDPGIVGAGHVARAVRCLEDVGVAAVVFDGVEVNPTTKHVDAGVEFALSQDVDFIIGLGGGSAMDCAKGINFILTNGGVMADYWGVGKAQKPMLPMMAVPTTAGTGSDAQSFALISDPKTGQKMACGDEKASFRIAVLDPDLIGTVPCDVAAATGIDAVAHVVETAGTTRRNDVSLAFSRAAWCRLERSFDLVMNQSSNACARADMLLGAHLAGAAIEHSMLGAAHACSNPVTARFGVTHGVAVGVMLPHVIRFNGAANPAANPYAALSEDFEQLALRIEGMLRNAGLPRCLADCGVEESALPELAQEAADEWTAGFNPTPVDASSLLGLYHKAYR